MMGGMKDEDRSKSRITWFLAGTPRWLIVPLPKMPDPWKDWFGVTGEEVRW